MAKYMGLVRAVAEFGEEMAAELSVKQTLAERELEALRDLRQVSYSPEQVQHYALMERALGEAVGGSIVLRRLGQVLRSGQK